jgi:hypothetical protein
MPPAFSRPATARWFSALAALAARVGALPRVGLRARTGVLLVPLTLQLSGCCTLFGNCPPPLPPAHEPYVRVVVDSTPVYESPVDASGGAERRLVHARRGTVLERHVNRDSDVHDPTGWRLVVLHTPRRAYYVPAGDVALTRSRVDNVAGQRADDVAVKDALRDAFEQAARARYCVRAGGPRGRDMGAGIAEQEVETDSVALAVLGRYGRSPLRSHGLVDAALTDAARPQIPGVPDPPPDCTPKRASH